MKSFYFVETTALPVFLSFFLLLASCVKEPVTGNRALVVTSLEQERQLGDKAWKQVQQEYSEHPQSEAAETVQRVGQRIVDQTRKSGFEWKFAYLDSPQENAFALPGGRIAVLSGMYDRFQNTAQLAAVLGHEVAHVTSRHAGQRLTLRFGESVVLGAVDLFLDGRMSPERQALLMSALGVGAQVGVNMPFSRGHESDADYIGLIYMARAGYLPMEAVRFWKEFNDGPRPPEFLSTHPHPQTRVEALKQHLAEANRIYAQHPNPRGTGKPL